MYVSALDEDFELKWDLKMKHDSLEELQKEVLEQKKRVEALRENAGKTNNQSDDVAILRIEDEQLIDQVDSLIDAAEHDQDALSQLDRRIRDLTSAIDEVEDAVEWPLFLEKAAESRKRATHRGPKARPHPRHWPARVPRFPSSQRMPLYATE